MRPDFPVSLNPRPKRCLWRKPKQLWSQTVLCDGKFEDSQCPRIWVRSGSDKLAKESLEGLLSRQRSRVRVSSSLPFLPNHLGMIGSYSFDPQLNPQKLLHCCVHPHGGRSAQRSESHPLKTHRT